MVIVEISLKERHLHTNGFLWYFQFVTVNKISLKSAVTNSTSWPYFWGTKNSNYIFKNLIKNPLVWKCLSFLDISTTTMFNQRYTLDLGLIFGPQQIRPWRQFYYSADFMHCNKFVALYHKCTYFTHGYSRDIQKRKALSH